MKFPNWLIALLLIVGGGLIGVVIALNTSPKPKWDKLVIPSEQKDVAEILFVDHKDFDKTDRDVIYVRTTSNNVYSVQDSEWDLLPSLPDGHIINKIGFNIGDVNPKIVATSNENLAT